MDTRFNGGVIMDVTSKEQAIIAEEAGSSCCYGTGKNTS